MTPTATPKPTADFAAIYQKQQSGVVRIETVSCTHAGVGTGFLLSPTLIATVDHVITQAAVVSLIDGDQRTTGTVIGSDPSRDLALVRADQPLSGYQFKFATDLPSVGDPVASIGFPIGGPITLTHGDVSGLDREITVEGTTLTGLLETDAPINPGNSGGPLIAADGSVVGLIDAMATNANGIGYAIPADQASAADRQWTAAPDPQPPADCQNPLGPSQQQATVPAPQAGSVTEDQLNGIVDTFNIYFGGIDSGDYAAAYSVQAPDRQSPTAQEEFAKGLTSSYDSNITILDAQEVDASTVTVDLAFNSLQTSAYGPDGDTCDNWTLVFTMVQDINGNWLMDGAKPYNGSTHTSC
ncbi:MAG: S1C family serine protease [Nakamurella sp.]